MVSSSIIPNVKADIYLSSKYQFRAITYKMIGFTGAYNTALSAAMADWNTNTIATVNLGTSSPNSITLANY